MIKYQQLFDLKQQIENSTELTSDLLNDFKSILPQEYHDRLKQSCINYINEELVHSFEKDFLQ